MKLRLLATLLMLAGSAAAADLTITWTDNSANEIGFRIERRLSSGPVGLYDTAGNVGINVTTFVDTGLQTSTEYCYRIVAVSEFGESFTAEECDTTAAAGEVAFITPPTLPNAQIGVAYAAPDLECAGGEGPPYVYTKTIGNFPTAVALSSGGAWSGTPGAGTAGVHVFTVECDDGNEGVAPREFTLPVLANSPAITTLTLPNGVEGEAYDSGAIEASCPLPPCVLSQPIGTLCAGTTLSDTSPPGAITGAATTTPQVCSFTLRVTDNIGQTADQAYTPTVVEAPITLALSTTAGSNGAVVQYGAAGMTRSTACTATVTTDADSAIVGTQQSLIGSARREAVFLGLTPATAYDIDVDCAAAGSASGSFTTLADPGSATVSMVVAATPNPILSDVDSILVEWGPEDLGEFENQLTVECPDGCAPRIGPLASNRIYRMRYSFVDAAAAPVARSRGFFRIVPPAEQGASSSLSSGLAHHWSMDEASGSRSDTLAPGAAWTANGSPTASLGKRNNAVAIDDNSYLSLDASTVFPSTTFTLAFWLKASDFHDLTGVSGSPIFVSNTEDHGIDIYKEPSTDRVIFKTFPTGTAIVPGNALTTGAAHIVIAWFDGSTGSGGIQIDNGTPVTFTGGSFSRASGTMFVGFNDSLAGFTGLFDELLLWDGRVLSAAERATLVSGALYPF